MKRKHCQTSTSDTHTHSQAFLKIRNRITHPRPILLLCAVISRRRRRRVASSKAKDILVFGDCISSFIFRFNSGEVKIVKNQKIKKEREAIYMEEDKPILIVRSYMSVFLFSFFRFCCHFYVLRRFTPARLFTRAPHQIRSFRVQSCRDQTICRALSHTHTYIQQGISLPSSFLLIFYYFYIRKKGTPDNNQKMNFSFLTPFFGYRERRKQREARLNNPV